MFQLALFSERLNELFFDNKVNVNEVEKVTGIPKSTLYRYLKAETVPGMEMLIRLADYFQCSVDYLIGMEADDQRFIFESCPPFSERFRFLLKKHTVSKYKLHKELGIPNTSLYLWQSGKRVPDIENLIKLSKYFHCSVDYILGREN